MGGFIALLLAGLALLVATAALVGALWCRSRLLQLQARLARQEDHLLALRGGLSAIAEEGLHEGRRGQALEQRVRQLSEYQEQLMMRDPEEAPFHHALRLASRGATAEELVQDCGITRGEAELVLALHRPGSDRAAGPDPD